MVNGTMDVIYIVKEGHLSSVIVPALAAHAAALVEAELQTAGLTPEQAGPGLRAYAATLGTAPCHKDMEFAMAVATAVVSARQSAFVPASQAFFRELYGDADADTVTAQAVVLHLMQHGVVAAAARRMPELMAALLAAPSESCTAVQVAALELWTLFLFRVQSDGLHATAPSAPTLTALLNELQPLNACVRIFAVAPDPRPEAALSVLAAMTTQYATDARITACQDAELLNLFADALAHSCRSGVAGDPDDPAAYASTLHCDSRVLGSLKHCAGRSRIRHALMQQGECM